MKPGRPVTNLLWGRFLSAMGIQLFLLSGVYGVFQQTKSFFLAGLTGLALFVPNLLLVFLAGHGTDRLRRVGALYVLCQFLFLAVTAAMLIPGPSPFLVLALFIAASALRALRTPAYYALTKWHADPSATASIARWMTVSWQLPLVLGPALFSFVQDLGGGVALSTVALSLMTAALLVSLPFWNTTRPENAGRENSRASAEAVLTAPARKRWLRASFADFLITGFSSFGILLPFLLEKIAEDPAKLGYLRAALSLGSLLCVSTLGRSARIAEDRVYGLALACVTIVSFGLSFASSFESFLFLCLAFGFLDGVSVLHREALQLSSCTAGNAGKTAALSQIFNSASDDLGDFRAGLTADWWGAPGALRAGAGLGITLCGVFWGGVSSQRSASGPRGLRIETRLESEI